jgi:hypothetical protein
VQTAEPMGVVQATIYAVRETATLPPIPGHHGSDADVAEFPMADTAPDTTGGTGPMWGRARREVWTTPASLAAAGRWRGRALLGGNGQLTGCRRIIAVTHRVS